MTHPLDPNVGAVLRDMARESLARLDQERRGKARQLCNRGQDKYLSLCPPGHVTRREIASTYGLSIGTIQYYVRVGKIPCTRVKNHIYFVPARVEAALLKIDHRRGRK